MARGEARPVVTLRSAAGTGQSHVARKGRRNTLGRLALRKFDAVMRQRVLLREER
ncbi:50S ribosomal protein L33 [Streptomyces sp. NPDC001880]